MLHVGAFYYVQNAILNTKREIMEEFIQQYTKLVAVKVWTVWIELEFLETSYTVSLFIYFRLTETFMRNESKILQI